MNTRKFTGDMASQVEADRDQLVEMREVLAWCDKNVVDVWVNSRWCVKMRGWDTSMSKADFTGPTLYAALHAAWSNRGKI